ncbi:hypothetical protein [Azospirillum palustre]
MATVWWCLFFTGSVHLAAIATIWKEEVFSGVKKNFRPRPISTLSIL